MVTKRGQYVYLVCVLCVFIGSIFLMKYASITGFFAHSQTSTIKFNQPLSLEFTRQKGVIETSITLANQSPNSFLKSISLTGEGNGFFRVWLAAKQKKILILDSLALKRKSLNSGTFSSLASVSLFRKNRFKASVAGITGFAVKDNNNGNNGQGNGNNNKGNNGQGNGNNNGGGDDEEDKDENNADSSDENSDSNNDVVVTQNALVKTNSRFDLERKLEAIYGPSWLTPKDKQNIRQSLQPQKVFETLRFDDACVGTCALPDGLQDSNYKLIVELDGDITFKQIDYSVASLPAPVVKKAIARMQQIFSAPLQTKKEVQTKRIVSAPRIVGSAVTDLPKSSLDADAKKLFLLALFSIALVFVFIALGLRKSSKVMKK